MVSVSRIIHLRSRGHESSSTSFLPSTTLPSLQQWFPEETTPVDFVGLEARSLERRVREGSLLGLRGTAGQKWRRESRGSMMLAVYSFIIIVL